MGAVSAEPAITPTGAVFLSYASQDAEAAQKICEALRAAGIEVWFDQSELRGGDVWDQKIRRQIHDCALFVPIISANTASRQEGYFRLEWDLADQRTHMIARDRAFIVPVCLDATPGAGTDVPESFHRVQWTRLPAGETPPAFAERVRRLLSPARDPAPTAHPAASSVSDAIPTARRPFRGSSWSKPALWVTVAVVFAALAYFVADKFWISKHVTASPTVTASTPATAAPTNAPAFSPPPHSIAVLPFVNLSGDARQDYFSDGLSEELLNSLARINELQVAARTSSFYFKGEHADLSTIAHKLNVASVLEGSVRRSGHTIRITAQLNNALTGFHLWSQTYDRDLRDVLAIQTEIANAVASALKVTLLGDITAKVELGGTRNPAAFDAYLRATKAHLSAFDRTGEQAAINEFSEAIRLDPSYALAYAGRSIALEVFAWQYATGSTVRDSFERVRVDADKAVALAPDLAEGHLAMAFSFESGELNFAHAREEYERALALAPNSERILRNYGHFDVLMGQTGSGLAALRRAVALDSLNPRTYEWLGHGLLYSRHYDEAQATYSKVIALDPDNASSYGYRGIAHYALGNFKTASSICEEKAGNTMSRVCLAVTYDKLGRHSDATAILAKIRAAMGDAAAYQCAEIYAQWGKPVAALEWLDTASRLRSPWLVWLKTDPLLDPLRKEPRFQAIERELKFPN